tara:strand:- start:4087 stop:4737 length:651 start_codon:yes stop_codon:yes gene_type:complete
MEKSRRKAVKAKKKRNRKGEKSLYKAIKSDGLAHYKEEGLSRREAKKKIKEDVKSTRESVKASVKTKTADAAAVSKMFADRRRSEAVKGGQKLTYDVGSKGRYQGTPEEVIQKTGGGRPQKTSTSLSQGDLAANQKAKAAAGPGDVYELIRPDGTKKKVRKKDPNKDYTKAKDGAKVKVIKKKKATSKKDNGVKPALKAAKDVRDAHPKAIKKKKA